MQKAELTALALSTLSMLLALSPLFHAYTPLMASKELYVEEYILSYRLTVAYHNRGNRTLALSDYDVAVPLFFSNELQEVELTWSSYPVGFVFMDPDGNRWAVLDVPDKVLVPGESLSFSVEYRITSREGEAPDISVEASGTLNQIPNSLREDYCGPAACWQTDFQPLRELAFNLSYGKEKVLEIVASFVSWIHSNIRYESYDMPRYPNETYLSRKGDCDDQANLFITLCRIVGIPAYLQLGCIYVPEATPRLYRSWEGHCETYVRSIGWHGWAVVYVPPWGWLPVDLTACMGLEEDPLNAIRTAIAWSQHTIMAAEIKVTDYIALSRSYREKVIHSGLHIREEEELKFVKKITSTTYPVRLYKQLLIYLTISVLVLGLTALGVAIYLLRRSRRAEVPAVVYPGQPGLAIRRSRLAS